MPHFKLTRNLYFHVPMPALIVQMSDGEEKAFSLAQEKLTLGRNPRNDIPLRDSYVSGYHAELRRGPDGRYEVVDLGSHNGTIVNGKLVQKCFLGDGDRIVFGMLESRFATVEPAGAVAPSKTKPSSGTGSKEEVTDATQLIRLHPSLAKAASDLKSHMKTLVEEEKTVLALKERKGDLEKVQTELKDLRSELEKLRKEKAEALELTASRDKVEAERKEAAEKLAKTQGEIREAETRRKSILEQEEKQKAALQKVETDLGTQRSELEKLKGAVAAARKEEAEASAELKRKLDEMQAELRKTTAENDEQKRQIVAARDELSQADAKVAAHRAEVEDLQRKERSLTEHLQMLNRQRFLAERESTAGTGES